MCVCVCVRACVLSRFSPVWLSVILWTVARQALLSMGFSRQKSWSGLPCPPPGDFPDPGIKPISLVSPALAGGFFTTSTTWHMLTSLLSDPVGFPRGSDSKESACSAGHMGLIPRSGRSSGDGTGYPLQYSFLENSMDRGAWQATVHGVTKSQTRLSN